jgi:UDP-N-acetylmuramoyl-tripeptide--D-alanyl-D-alanine ligase
MNHLGEIDYLSRIAQPNVALINNAGTAHIGELGSRENIAKAKGEIFNGLNNNGIAVINADDTFCAYWQSLNAGKKIITFGLSKTADITASYTETDGISLIQLSTPKGSVTFKLNMLGKHNIANALAASAVAVALGVSNHDIANGLQNMRAVHSRLQSMAGLNGALLIDDTYNANPDSMKAAIDVLAAIDGARIFVMGDMGELGADAAQMHADIGAYARQKGITNLLAFGALSANAVRVFGKDEHSKGAQHFLELNDLINNVKSLMQKNVTVLVKGSRFMKMERVVESLTQQNLEKSLMEDVQCY